MKSYYGDDFIVSCSNSNVDQMAEAFSVHSSNIEEWADEPGLVISAPKLTIALFTLQFAQSYTPILKSLNNSILPLEKTPGILGVTFNPHFKFNSLPRINILKALTGTNWGQ